MFTAELSRPKQHLQIKDIEHDNKLIRLFTGFTLVTMFSILFNFLGPAGNNLNYRGEKEGDWQRKCRRKMDPENQLFLTLVKLKFNVRLNDVAYQMEFKLFDVYTTKSHHVCSPIAIDPGSVNNTNDSFSMKHHHHFLSYSKRRSQQQLQVVFSLLHNMGIWFQEIHMGCRDVMGHILLHQEMLLEMTKKGL